eukprot:s1334_g8.t1
MKPVLESSGYLAMASHGHTTVESEDRGFRASASAPAGAKHAAMQAINRVLRQGVRPESSRSRIPIVLPDWCEKGTSLVYISRSNGAAHTVTVEKIEAAGAEALSDNKWLSSDSIPIERYGKEYRLLKFENLATAPCGRCGRRRRLQPSLSGPKTSSTSMMMRRRRRQLMVRLSTPRPRRPQSSSGALKKSLGRKRPLQSGRSPPPRRRMQKPRKEKHEAPCNLIYSLHLSLCHPGQSRLDVMLPL